MIPSPYQDAIYRFPTERTGSLIVEAVAGSGKTTTLVELVKRLPREDEIRFFAFNRIIADHLKGRLIGRRNCTVSTFHSAGWQAILKSLPNKVETQKWKMPDLLKAALGHGDYTQYKEPLLRLLGLAKASIFTPETPLPEWQDLVEHHGLDFDWLIPPRTPDREYQAVLDAEIARVLSLAQGLLDMSNYAAKEPFAQQIDFDDQLYLAVLWDLPLQQYDWVLVDELQDTNAVQREIIRRSLKPGGRLIGVGDPHQAIYGWRGASHDAMDLVRKEFVCATLPLSVCYRCAWIIVQKAKEIVPQIEAAPDAPLGMVVENVAAGMLAQLTPQDAILCRNNAPLVSAAYQLIKQGIGVQILGKDLGTGLLKLIQKSRATTVPELEQWLAEYKDRETRRYRQLKQEAKAAGVEDRVGCITQIISGLDSRARSLPLIEQAIGDLFGDGSKPVLTLSTIHKAKGREWPTVAIVRPDLLPSYWASLPWQQQQERNLQYVAWTRAQQRLWIMDDAPEWRRKKRAKESGEMEPNEVGVQGGRWDR